MMPAFFLALIAAGGAALGGREAVRVAGLSAALGRAPGLLAACRLACLGVSGMAAGLGLLASERLGSAPVTGVALGLAALLLAVQRPPPTPAEPTRSFGAIGLVLGAGQLVSSTALLVVAIAASFVAPGPAAVGGALGSSAALTAAWLSGDRWEACMPVSVLRWTAATLLLVAALIVVAGRGALP